MTALKQLDADPFPHRTAWDDVRKLALNLAGDVVLVPDPDNLAGLQRESLIKVAHWDNADDDGKPLLTPDSVDRLAVLTDSFFRFIDDGEDASVITLLQDSTVHQIDGAPCAEAIDLVAAAVKSSRPLCEKWIGLSPLEEQIEMLAYQKGFMTGHRPKWLEREARRRLDEANEFVARHPTPKPIPVAANDNIPSPALRLVNPADWFGLPVPTREWYAEELIPNRQVTILNGDGGVGKSLLALQIAAAGSMGIDTVDIGPTAGRVLYLGAEDEEEEFWRRLQDITFAHSKSLRHLADFRLIPLADQDALLAVPDKAGNMKPTPLMLKVIDAAAEFQPRLIVLDTAADLFGGDEIKRGQVRQFIGALRQIAIAGDCAVVLLAHPSLQGMQSGTGSSGSTAWNNSVRSRLYLTADKDDPDLRVLSTMKSNYGRKGGEMELRWRDGAFVLDDGKPTAASALIHAQAERVFRDALSAINRTGDRVARTKGVNYAPKIIAARPEASGITVKTLEATMHAMLSSGEVKIVMEGPPSKSRQRLILASEDFGPDRLAG